MVKKRRRHSAACKFRIALEALEGSKTISQLSSEREIHANLIRAWKRQLLEDGPSVFAGTFSPSRRHIRSTRLWFTCQPRCRRSAVILR